MKQTSLRAQIRQLCCLGLSAETLMPRLLPLIRQLVPADSAGFFWVDSSGDMHNLYAERMLPSEHMRLYFEHFYDSDEHPFRRQFLARVQAGIEVDSSSADAALQRTAYYNEILRELDAHHVLYGVVRDHGSALGQISLYRPRKSSEFDAKARADLASILHYVAHAVAIRNGLPIELATESDNDGINKSQQVDTDDEAVVIAHVDGRLLHASEQARRLLVQAVDGAFAPGRLRAADTAVTDMIVRLAEMLRDTGSRPPLLTVQTRWGRLQLRAYRLGDAVSADAPIAIRIARQEPMLLKFAEALRTLGMPPQQQDIALRMAQGKSNQEIAQGMGLSPNTVAYHIKQIFSKLNAHGRAETISRILESPH
ncbi:MAG TPA: LuxR C-terminal-related transcriptional regulator [Usitatibacteraceae bacterium]